MRKLSVRELVLCGLFIALITVGTFIRIPVGTDVYTLQFLFTLLAGLVLGARLGAAAVGAYVILGLIGVPVFASGGGPGYIIQPTFGYLLGFTLQAGINGWLVRRLGTPRFVSLLLANVAGMVVVYLLGISYFYYVSNYVIAAPISLWLAVWYCGILQAPADFLLCVAAALIGVRCYRAGIWLEQTETKTWKMKEA